MEQVASAEPVALICALFDVPRSCFYAYRQRRHRVDAARMAIRSRVHELFIQSRSSAGSRSIVGMLHAQGAVIGRFKVRRLMNVSGRPAPSFRFY